MKAIQTRLAGVVLFEPTVFADARGFFYESFNQRVFAEHTGFGAAFVQDNHSHSLAGVVRGLHYQLQHPQGKLVRVVQGEVFDVAVDLRRQSSTFGEWFGIMLSASNRLQLWIPPGFAHGFAVVSPSADFLYKTTDVWYPNDEHCIRFDDPSLDIRWPTSLPAVVSDKDRAGLAFEDARTFA